ncbi:RmlC-like cupin domain-containing protein [Pisolithus tinctorius]|nr:RmlC-like cupin domain-containing protein [Pisolithus tinctorius]
MSTTSPVFLIVPTIQQYGWGKMGKSSKVAQLAESAVPGFALSESIPYAELWMGTHVKSPSGVPGYGVTLRDFLAGHPELMGGVSSVFDTTGGNLPFLLKVLSIGKALSIQVHPDKKTAEKLHAQQPSVYTDPNHKPEIAIALTPFRGLCGFSPASEIKAYLAAVPEFRAIAPEEVVRRFEGALEQDERAALRDFFTGIMTADADRVKEELSKLVSRYLEGRETGIEHGVRDLVLALNSQHPGDVGIFCAFMLNLVDLQPGEAIFLGAGEPHAYVSGDIIECMANSDNVIRAGLTPKPKDVPNLIESLTYNAAKADSHMVQPKPLPETTYTTTYVPPVLDFRVLAVKIPENSTERHPSFDSASIAIITGGSGSVMSENEDGDLALSMGNAVFIGANVSVSFRAGNEGMSVYRAYAATCS